MRLVRSIAVGLAILAVAASVTGCASQPSSVTQEAPPEASVAPAPEPMQSVEKKRQLPSEFPIEVPVPRGTITRADRQGADVWVYEIAVASSPEQTLAWYEQAYKSANWGEIERSAAGEGTRVLFEKGSAQTEVQVRPAAAGSTAEVAIGIGVPVGETF
ncbi:MAG: hypothetical protein HY876_09790 [Coriobacteriales bacterium]|nr:hypothetical protein [Coriobacteriales bacterium]